MLCHIAEKFHVLGAKAGGLEFLVGECSKPIVERIKLDPLLIEAESDRLVVEIGFDHVTRKGTISSKTASRGVGCRLRLSQLAVSIVVGSGRVERKGRNSEAQRSSGNRTEGGRNS